MKKNNRTLKRYEKSCEAAKINEYHNNDCNFKNRKAKYRIVFDDPYKFDFINICKDCKNDLYTLKNGDKLEEILAIIKINKFID